MQRPHAAEPGPPNFCLQFSTLVAAAGGAFAGRPPVCIILTPTTTGGGIRGYQPDRSPSPGRGARVQHVHRRMCHDAVACAAPGDGIYAVRGAQGERGELRQVQCRARVRVLLRRRLRGDQNGLLSQGSSDSQGRSAGRPDTGERKPDTPRNDRVPDSLYRLGEGRGDRPQAHHPAHDPRGLLLGHFRGRGGENEPFRAASRQRAVRGHTEDPDDLLMAAAERGVARASAGSWGAAAVLAALAISPAPAGADPVTKSIRVASTPPGSWICFKQRGAFECDARTPAAIEVEFYDEDDVKTLYLRRPGYEPFTRKITRDTASLAPALARAADLYRGFPDTPQAAKVRRALDGLLYGGNAPPIDHPYIDLVPGSLRLVDIDGKDYLHVSLLAGRAFSDRELRKLYRLRNR